MKLVKFETKMKVKEFLILIGNNRITLCFRIVIIIYALKFSLLIIFLFIYEPNKSVLHDSIVSATHAVKRGSIFGTRAKLVTWNLQPSIARSPKIIQ